MDAKKLQENLKYYSYWHLIGGTVALHPVTLVHTLIQAGVEPVKPQMRRTYTGTKSLSYPGILPYMRHIVIVDGWRGLFRGAVPSVAYELSIAISKGVIAKPIHAAVSKGMDLVGQHAPDSFKEVQKVEDYYRLYIKRFIVSSMVTTVSCTLFHPLKVIAVRSMVQFDGRETVYDSIFGACKEIYKNEGVGGFFAGLVPLLVANIESSFFLNLFSMFFEQCVHLLVPDLEKMGQFYTILKQWVVGLSVSHLVFPYRLVSTVMIINDSGLKASQHTGAESFDHWSSCYSYLVQNGLDRRGAYVLFNRPIAHQQKD